MGARDRALPPRRAHVVLPRGADSGRKARRPQARRPWTPARREILAFRLWSGRAAPDLLRADEAGGALLLERIEPGTPLADGASGEEIVRVARLLRALHALAASAASCWQLPPLADVVEDQITTAGAEAAARSPAEATALRPALERARHVASRASRELGRRRRRPPRRPREQEHPDLPQARAGDDRPARLRRRAGRPTTPLTGRRAHFPAGGATSAARSWPQSSGSTPNESGAGHRSSRSTFRAERRHLLRGSITRTLEPDPSASWRSSTARACSGGPSGSASMTSPRWSQGYSSSRPLSSAGSLRTPKAAPRRPHRAANALKSPRSIARSPRSRTSSRPTARCAWAAA